MMLHHLKPYSWRYGVLALILLIGCRKTAENSYNIQSQESILAGEGLAIDKGSPLDKLDLGNIKPPPLPANYKEIVTKHRVIAGSKVRKIIDSISGVLVNILAPKTKGQMLVPACFSDWHNQEVMFVPALLVEEAVLLVQDYYQKRPRSNKVQIISVEKLEDWLQLLQKSVPGMAADKKTGIYSRRDYVNEVYEKHTGSERRSKSSNTDGGINKFFDHKDYTDPSEYYKRYFFRTYTKRRLKKYYKWIRLCSREWMHDALDTIPPQIDGAIAFSWSCGPTSAAKAIHMFGEGMTRNYFLNTFLGEAPNRHNIQTSTGENLYMWGLVAEGAGILLAPFTGGASVIVGHGIGVSMQVGGGVAVMTAPDPGGVPIRNLAQQISNYLPGTKHARYHGYDDWNECANTIRDDIQRGNPVIITQRFSSLAGHYLNVVGVKVDSNNHPVAFMLFNTDNLLYSLSVEDMEYLMEQKYMARMHNSPIKNYRIVRFYR